MKQKLFVLMLLAAGALSAGISIGINIGRPPHPRVVHVRPVSPGPGYSFIEGYWYPVNGHYRWHDGYWTRPPYEGAVWIGPRHDGHQFFEGHWEGSRGVIEHDHRYDRDRDRDYRGDGDHR
jgi:hypothetical protein